MPMKVKTKESRDDSAHRPHPSVPREILDRTSSCFHFPLIPWPLRLILKVPLGFPMAASNVACFGWEGGDQGRTL